MKYDKQGVHEEALNNTENSDDVFRACFWWSVIIAMIIILAVVCYGE